MTPSNTTHLDTATLKARAERLYRLDADYETTYRGEILANGPTLTPEERNAMIAFIYATDGIIGKTDDPRLWVDKHDAFLAGVYLGSIRRAAFRQMDLGGN